MQNDTEEIDVIVTNRSTDPLLQRQGDFIVIECKNWTSRVGVDVLTRLTDKVRERYARARLGISVAMNGYAETVQQDRLAERRGDVLVLLLTGEDLERWIMADDRAEWLVERIGSEII